jgi:hypothetical protein
MAKFVAVYTKYSILKTFMDVVACRLARMKHLYKSWSGRM